MKNSLATIAFYSLVGNLLVSWSASAAVYPITPTTDVVGQPQITIAKYEDSFITLAAKYNVGFDELIQANPHVDPWIPGEGTVVVVPSRYVLPPRNERQGIVINLAELRLYYFPANEEKVYTYPLGIGRMDWKTPLGKQKITQKLKNANWYVPESIKKEAALEGRTMPDFIPPGDENPMGYYKMRLSDPSYLIHGTNKEAGIGRRVSHGCINMYNDDVEQLYGVVPMGTTVNIIHEPYKAGWDNNYLWLEAHKPLDDYTDDYTLSKLMVITQNAVNNLSADVDWSLAKKFYGTSTGMPMVIGTL